ncbi:hypothetical protein Ami103574_08660 [Aminipila butyrica]|uniref:Bypass of forespore C C-terminal domain-containing protein n=1 Tax=Aminipila butyrica TaxID=433296 RepID=A0A858BTY4_9FIRM|nr:hypothetical protein [Aminipila butyrica]QIB69393.1 hypothetical protein Ami103574_08660 [Aminipila butyrica]
MFTRKKRLAERKEFYIALAAVLGVGYLMFNVLLTPETPAEGQDISANAGRTVKQSTEKVSQDSDKDPLEEEPVQKNSEEKDENPSQENQASEYYLVKEADGVIKVYQYDDSGQEQLLRTTDILFSLLGKEDQNLFSEGVVVHSEDELLELLQDFES